MPSVFTHPAVPVSLALACGRRRVSPRLLAAGVVASVLPDLDSIGLRLGIPYGHTLGHRGFLHSILFALLIGGAAALFRRGLSSSAGAAFAVCFVACASHGVLDAFTSGGLGVAFLSPFSDQRYFFPWRPIAVSPLSVRRFFSEWGLRVVRSELLTVWAPACSLGSWVVWSEGHAPGPDVSPLSSHHVSTSFPRSPTSPSPQPRQPPNGFPGFRMTRASA